MKVSIIYACMLAMAIYISTGIILAFANITFDDPWLVCTLLLIYFLISWVTMLILGVTDD